MNKKKLAALLLFAIILLFYICPANAEISVQVIEPELEQMPLDIPDSDAAFEGYVDQLFGIAKPQPLRLMALRLLGAGLTGNNKAIYDVLKPQIQQVAAGERGSTVFTITAAQLGLDGHYFAADLGVDEVIVIKDGRGVITEEAADAMHQIAAFDSNRIFSVLLRDCPYEMYWCDKTVGVSISGFGIFGGRENGEYYLNFNGDIKFSFAVTSEYRADGSTDIYAINTTIAQTASAAAATAQTVVATYADDADYEKLLDYKEWICEHVSYNSEAAGGGVAYGNPWQLIWVFDNDPNTRVVCEGYAKAFQYLCDKSSFTDHVDCRTATGRMGTENHMWNIVEMPNEKNYMVDVTNCDGTSIGAPDKLFLVGCADGNASDGYHMAVGRGVLYTYDETTRGLYSENELTLSEVSYLEEENGIPIDEAHFPNAAFREMIAATCDTDPEGGDGMLSAAEREAVIELDVSDKGIDDLAGIRYFQALETLNCGGNALEGLDLTNMATLTALDCSGNGLTTLVITGCAGLETVDCSDNMLTEIDLLSCTALTSLDCSDNMLTEIDLLSCTALTSLDCGDNGLTALDISGCAALKALAVRDNLAVGESRVDYSDGVHALRFDTGVRLVRSHDAPRELALPDDTKRVGEGAFEGTGVELIVIPSGCTGIGSRAFADCTSLAEVRMPASVESDALPDDVFSGSEGAIIVTGDPGMQAWATSHGMLWCAE